MNWVKKHRLKIDYAAVRDARTLEELGETPAAPSRALVAARLGDVRLIDNMGVLRPPHLSGLIAES